MGCASNKNLTFENVCNTPEFQNLQKVFDNLEITLADTRKLFDVFYSLTAGLHSIPLGDILEYLGLSPTAFVCKVFTIFNRSATIEIDFRAFVLCCWNYCTLNRFNLGKLQIYTYATV